jgi:hypothetical protein
MNSLRQYSNQSPDLHLPKLGVTEGVAAFKSIRSNNHA